VPPSLALCPEPPQLATRRVKEIAAVEIRV
jgi:hypothetical protein